MKQEEMKVVMVPTNSLRPHPKNNFYWSPLHLSDKLSDRKKYQEIFENIQSVGVLNPLEVQFGTNIIVDGHQRWQIAMQLEIPVLPVLLYKYTDEEAENRVVEANFTRRGDETDPIRLAHQAERLRKIHGMRHSSEKNMDGKMTSVEIAKNLNMGKSTLYNYEKLTHLIPELQRLVRDKVLNKTSGRNLSQYPPEVQRNYLNTIDLEHTKKIPTKDVEQWLKVHQWQQDNPKHTSAASMTLDREIELDFRTSNQAEETESNPVASVPNNVAFSDDREAQKMLRVLGLKDELKDAQRAVIRIKQKMLPMFSEDIREDVEGESKELLEHLKQVQKSLQEYVSTEESRTFFLRKS